VKKNLIKKKFSLAFVNHKKNMTYGNYLLARCSLKEKNYEEELNYLIKGHSYYLNSDEVNY